MCKVVLICPDNEMWCSWFTANCQYSQLMLLHGMRFHVDCIGLWMIELCGGMLISIQCPGPVLILLPICWKLKNYQEKPAQACADAFESGCLARYPSSYMMHSWTKVPEFIGNEFQQLLSKVGVKSVSYICTVILRVIVLLKCAQVPWAWCFCTLIHLHSPQTWWKLKLW